MGSSIKDVLAKTDFLDTPPSPPPPCPTSSVFSQTSRPYGAQKHPELKIYCNLDACGRGRGGSHSNTDSLNAKKKARIFLFVAVRLMADPPVRSRQHWHTHTHTPPFERTSLIDDPYSAFGDKLKRIFKV